MRTRRGRIGSNQFKARNRDLRWLTYVLSYELFVLGLMCFTTYFQNLGAEKVYAQMPVVSPLPTGQIEQTIEVKTDEQKEIVAYIKEVFGKDADKAFKVLSCENSSLNPNAVNTAGNSPEGSRDTGVFQINEYWQKVQYKFLLNYKVNIEIAYQIFKENGNSFERWSCGRRMGI